MKESPEEIARFAAEMAQLSKRPEMKPYLTSTEARRQERESLKEAAAEQERKEAWMIESKRRDDITARWFNHHMNLLCKATWQKFKKAGELAITDEAAAKAVKILTDAGWHTSADMTTATKPGHEPTPVTVCVIKKNGKVKRVERLVWEEPKPIKSKLVKL